MNEATIWSRAIYPLLLLAEQGEIEAWAEVSFVGQFQQFEVGGEQRMVPWDAVWQAD
jgi:hypothetical protein